MGVVVAHCTVHLAQDFDVGDAVNAGLQPHQDVGNFFAHRGGARRLAVCAAEHGHVGVGMGHFTQLEHDAVQRRQQHHIAPGAQLQCVAGVVDVFAGASKVHKLGGSFQLGPGFELGLDPVLHCLHVVVGDLFNLLDGIGIGLAEVLDQSQQVGARTGRQWFEFGKTGIAQGYEPGHLHLHAAVHVALLAHVGAQGGQFGGVSTVQG